jgi:hypothetical protein
MPAAAKPWNTARSSAIAIARAAAMTGLVSGSLAPRSTSSRSARLISNGTRNSTSGSTLRSRARTLTSPGPSVGEAIASLRPSPIADAPQPCGPTKSTSRRAASVVFKVRVASFSISCQPAVEIGASSRSRWFMALILVCRASQIADAEMSLGRHGRGRLGLFRGDQRLERRLGEQVFAQIPVERRVLPAQPFEHHRGVLLLLVAVVREDRRSSSSAVARRAGRTNRPPRAPPSARRSRGAIDNLGAERFRIFVQGLAGHSGPFV